MISARTRSQLFRYVLTGGTSAVVDTCIFTTLHATLGLAVPLASLCSFCVAAVVNYSLASIFVFGHALELRRLARFVAVAMIGMAINVGVTVTANATIPFGPLLGRLAQFAGISPGLVTPYAATAAKICGIGVAFLLNFYLNSTVVFRDRRVAAPRPVA